MSNFIDRFKHRNVASAELEIKLGGAVFIVQPFSQVELEEGRRKAVADAMKAGIPADQLKGAFLEEIVGVGYADVIKRHILRVEIGAEKFERPVIDQIFAEMDVMERYTLALAYLSALEQDRKKKAVTSPQSSPQSSSADSVTN